MDLGISERVAPLIKAVRDMVENEIAPLDAEYHALVGPPHRGSFQTYRSSVGNFRWLKSLARERGLGILAYRQ